MAGKNPHVGISPIKVSIQIAFIINKFIYYKCNLYITFAGSE